MFPQSTMSATVMTRSPIDNELVVCVLSLFVFFHITILVNIQCSDSEASSVVEMENPPKRQKVENGTPLQF